MKRKQYWIILLNPLLLLVYLEGMRRIYESCQYGGLRRRLGGIVLLGGIGILWVLGFTAFWLYRKRSGDLQGKENAFSHLLAQYGSFILGIELISVVGITGFFGYRIYQSAQPYQGHLSWYLQEKQFQRELMAQQDSFPIGSGEESPEPPASAPAVSEETDWRETSEEALENEENQLHERGEVVAENDELTFYLDEDTYMKLSVVDAALGSRMYAFSGPKADNPNPFPEVMGVARGILFFDENTGLVLLGSASDSFSRLFYTGDGGESFQLIEPPVAEGEKDIRGNLLGYTVEDYDYPGVPYVENGKLYLHVSTEAQDQNTQYLMFQSWDLGKTWSYLGYYEG